MFCPCSWAKTATTKKKNSRPTGAKKVIRDARGPGFSFCGSSIPMLEVVTMLSKFQSPLQPPSMCSCFEGDNDLPAPSR